MDKNEIYNKIKALNSKIELSSDNNDLLHNRAELFESIQEYGKAINDYLKILKSAPADKVAQSKLNMLRSILKYSNIDIYASTNTNMDPWLD